MKKVLIMAGGTGGHIVPGLAVAESLQAQGCTVHWLGTRAGLEAEMVPAADIPISYISIVGLRRRGVLNLVLGPVRIFYSILQALRVVWRFKPDLVIGMGGYVTGPGGIAAWLLRKPLIVHEQNSIAGYTNLILARFARYVLQAFPNAFTDKFRPLLTGNPVRAEIANLPMPQERFAGREGAIRILILGGSRGALAINQMVPKAVSKLNDRPEIWHQSGSKSFDETKGLYEANKVEARVDAFIDDMAAAYAWADVVICRAGALTVSELTAAGVGSVLIPYPHAVDDHQTTNGEYLQDVGAAYIIPQSVLTVENFASLIAEISADRGRLAKMAEAAYTLRRPDATDDIVKLCLQI